MPANRDEIPPGTLHMLIFKVLARGKELHGFEIANAIQQFFEEVLQVKTMDEYGRLALAFKKSAGDNALELLRRYKYTAERAYHRALQAIEQIQKDRTPPAASAAPAETENNKQYAHFLHRSTWWPYSPNPGTPPRPQAQIEGRRMTTFITVESWGKPQISFFAKCWRL